jgi:hypothetical protein
MFKQPREGHRQVGFKEMFLGWGPHRSPPDVPRPLSLTANAMHTTFDYRGRPIMVRTRPRDRETRADGNVYALSPRGRGRLVMPPLKKAGQAA